MVYVQTDHEILSPVSVQICVDNFVDETVAGNHHRTRDSVSIRMVDFSKHRMHKGMLGVEETRKIDG